MLELPGDAEAHERTAAALGGRMEGEGGEGEVLRVSGKYFFLKTDWRQNGVATRRKRRVSCSWTNDISRPGEWTTRRILDLYILPDFRHKL